MYSIARKQEESVGFDPVDDIINHEELGRGLKESLLATAAQIFEQDGPTYWSQYVGALMYLLGVHNTVSRLKNLGFRAASPGGQCRAVSRSHFICPVDISIHAGAVSEEGIARFKWPRGQVTANATRLNRVNYPDVQLPLLNPELPAMKKPNEIHFSILYHMSPKHLQAWLVLGTKWIDSRTMACSRWTELCNERELGYSIPDYLPPNDDSSYGIDFGEL